MEIIRNSTNISGFKDHISLLRVSSMAILALIYFCIGVSIHAYYRHNIDLPFVWYFYYFCSMFVLITGILILSKYISFPLWYMWNGPIIEINGENFESIQECTSWLSECMPKSSKYVIGERYSMIIFFRYNSDLVMFKTSW